jgi:hypothetical protein
MSSRSTTALTHLERDLPTTPRDVEALRRAAALVPPEPFAAVQALMDALPAAARRPSRKTAAGWAPFEL